MENREWGRNLPCPPPNQESLNSLLPTPYSLLPTPLLQLSNQVNEFWQNQLLESEFDSTS